MDPLDFFAKAFDAPFSEHDLEFMNSHLTGLDATLGFRYTHVAHSDIRAEVTISEALLQPMGLAHGGMLAALAESAGSLAGMIVAKGPVVGVNNSTDFISSARPGDAVKAQVSPVQLGRRTQLWDITMTTGDKLVARTTLRTMVV